MNTQAVLEQLFQQGTVFLEEPKRLVHIHHANLETLGPILGLIEGVLDDLKLDVQNIPTINFNDPVAILKLVAPRLNPVIEVAATHCDVPLDELRVMPLDQSLLVIQAVILKNKDFFMTKVLPIFLVAPKEKAESEQPQEQPSSADKED